MTSFSPFQGKKSSEKNVSEGENVPRVLQSFPNIFGVGFMPQLLRTHPAPHENVTVRIRVLEKLLPGTYIYLDFGSSKLQASNKILRVFYPDRVTGATTLEVNLNSDKQGFFGHFWTNLEDLCFGALTRMSSVAYEESFQGYPMIWASFDILIRLTPQKC
ncbi:hypothetical protein B0H11DRAFT_1915874 [Mycena galericulata]|nr:hypothetical protein B0H11DRAFT_1915874 [Mycena galericulata]